MRLFEKLRRRCGLGASSRTGRLDEAEPQPELGDACRSWRQGDVFTGGQTYVFDHQWSPHPVQTVHGAALISQSCDASLPHRERVQIAPVVRLEDEEDLREALDGKRTQHVALPRLGEDFFADLDGLTTVMKTALLESDRVSGVETDKEVREFAFSVSRRFGRFAYPDEVSECLKPLADALRSKARKEKSPLGQVLDNVHSFRVHCEDWTTAPYVLTIIVILEPGVVSSDLDSIGACPDDLEHLSTKPIGERIAALANYLNSGVRSETERYFAWHLLADAWAQRCEETAVSRDLTAMVGSVTALLTSTDEFPLSQFLQTESLDLDYLSDSRKAPE